MSQEFERIIHVKVGPEGNQETFAVHVDLMEKHMFYFARVFSSTPNVKTWSLPTIMPRSFHLLLDYIYGGPLTLSWENEQDRLQLVDAWVLGDMVAATRFCNAIIEFTVSNATRVGTRKILPDNACIARAYVPGELEKNAPIRRLFCDLYVHFGNEDSMNALLLGSNNLRDFWFDYCERARCRDDHDEHARQVGNPLHMFNPRGYFNNTRHMATPQPIPVSRAGTKAYLCHYDGVNTIVIEDGKPPMYIHRELSELREDILRKCPPREITFPYGYRNATVIFLKWLYFGSVTQECYDMKDFIRAYSIGMTMYNPQFRDDVLTGIVSYCTRNHILPSASEIALAYQTTTTAAAAADDDDPLRHFMVYWTLTHKHASPLNPAALPADPALRDAFAADLDAERAHRTASVNEDLRRESGAQHDHRRRRTHPRLYADEQFGGDTALGGAAGAAPYYGDDICRLHAAHPYHGYRRALANADRDIDGGIAGLALLKLGEEGEEEEDRGDPVTRLLGFSTKAKESERDGMKSTAATGWQNPGNDVETKNGVRNPCHELLRKRNCYGAVVVGYRPKAIELAHERKDKGKEKAVTGEGEVELPRTITDDPAMLEMLDSAEASHAACKKSLQQQTSALTTQIAENEHRPFEDSDGSTPYVSPTEPYYTGGFPLPQTINVPGSGGYEGVNVNPVAAFNALRLPPGWQQRRCVDGRAYFVRVVPGMMTEASWVDPRDAVVWRRSDEVSYVEGMGWGFEEGTETEKDTESEGSVSAEETGDGGEDCRDDGDGGDDGLA